MAANNWANVESKMLADFEHRATFWLGKIDECFKNLGGAFDKKFRFKLVSNNSIVEMDLRFAKSQNRNEEDNPNIAVKMEPEQQNASTSNRIENPIPTGAPIDILDSSDEVSLDENGPNALIDDGHNEENGDVKQEPIEEDIPMIRFMANEVDTNDGYNANDNYENLNDPQSLLESRSDKKKAKEIRKSNVQKPSCSGSVKRFKCSQCDYATDRKDAMNRHMLKHTGEKPYRCEHCSRCFTRLDHRRKHMSTHKDVFPFHCTGCFRGFSQKNEKHDHEMGCSNRRYECLLCKTYETTIKTKLKHHMRRHTGEKPFRCEVCMKYFQQKHNLKKHFNRIHNRK